METLERNMAPAFRDITHIDVLQATRYVLDNGIPVYCVNAGEQQLVKVEIVFRNRHHHPADVLVASATNRMLAEGTSRHTALQLADGMDYFGAFYETEEGLDVNTVNLYTLTKHLEKTLPYLLEILCDPVFPEPELEVFRQNSIQRLRVNQEKVSYLARIGFQEVLFGKEHPYGYKATAEDFKALESKTLRTWYESNYGLTGAMIFVAGKAGEDVIAQLNATFGQVKPSANVNGQSGIGVAMPFLEKKHFLQKKDALQSALRIGRLLFNKTHPDYHGMLVLNTVLGGYFGSRLMANLREDKGFTYGIGSGLVSLMQGGYLVISTEVASEVTEQAMDEIFAELKRLTTDPVPEDELVQVRNYLLGSLMRSMDGAFNLADRAKGLVQYGLDYDYYDKYFKTVREMTSEKLLELARKYYIREDFYQLHVGDK